jgi:hypothetical protein
VGQPLDRLRDNLTRLAKDTGRPHALLLQEAKRGGWSIPGYQNIIPDDPEVKPDNCRILLRDDAAVLDSGAVRVPGDGWVWNDNEKPMRTYPWVAASWDGQTVVLVSVHRIPNGPIQPRPRNNAAWGSEHRTLTKMGRDLSDRFDAPVVFGGDWNASLGEQPSYAFSLRSLTADLDATAVAIPGIDGFVAVGAELEDAEHLKDKYGSDGHRPVTATAVVG